MSKIIHVLLTGGVGSRLWPLSRRSKPKQYLEIFSGRSLFELALTRNFGLSEELIVVGNQENSRLSEEIMEKLGISARNHIKEATPRNTAAAISFAAFAANPEDILLVTPSDHLVEEEIAYYDAVHTAVSLAKQDHIVTFGIPPNRPETGYGYIEVNGTDVRSFREKPDAQTAAVFVKDSNFLWNSGLFCFKSSIFLEELERHAPRVYESSQEAWKKADAGFLHMESSLQIPCISVDYAVMERSRRMKVVKANFSWSDMGSFDAVYDYLKEMGQPVDPFGNMQIGATKFTSFVGLHNCIFVSTKDADLILSKQASQEVKGLYEELERNNVRLIQ